MNARWRRHWKIPALLVAFVVALVAVLGENRIVAYVGESGETSGYANVLEYSAGVDLFDDSIMHEVSLEIEEADWEAMLRLYLEAGTKEYSPADITIDGVTIENVGVRLKGNSTLRSAVRSVDTEPTDVPLLVKLDEYIDGLSYQGVTELALRTEGPNIRGGVNFEEIVGSAAYEAAGLDFPRTTYAGLSINGADATLRVIAEHPNDEYTDARYGTDGVLYKAQTGGSFTYLGDDPTAYESAFSQESAGNVADLTPLIEFLAWADGAGDEEFGVELEEWLDVETFADYLAVSNLLVNVDSLAGTGHNYYLWWDETEERFTVLAWDLNENFGGFWFSDDPSTELLPDWSNATMSGFGPGGGFPPGLGGGGGFGPGDRGGLPQREELPEGTESPGGLLDIDPGGRMSGAPTEGTGPRTQAPAGGGMLDFNNLLRERFLADDEFAALYEERYAALYDELLASGVVADLVAEYATVLDQAVEKELIEEREVEQAAASVLEFLEDRTAFLADVNG